MMKTTFRTVCTLCAVFFLAGCARQLSVTELLGAPEQAVIRTAYNLWYTDPLEMDSVNTQQGKMIPFGTEVQIAEATEDEIRFTTLPDGKEFRIRYTENYRMQPVEDYLLDLFTLQTQDELRKKASPLTFEKISRGIVEKGMTRGEVLLAYGPPCAFRTPDIQSSTWIYPQGFLEYKRVVFKGDTVLDIIQP